MASQSGGIIGGAMSQGTDPNAATGSTTSNTNPSTATSATSSGSTSGSPSDFMGQLNSSASSTSNSTPADATGGSSPSPTSSNDDASEIENLYKTDLGRDSDPGGMAFFQGLLNDGNSIGTVQQDILNSDEYKSLHPAATSTPATPQAATYAASTLGTPTQLGVGSEQTVQGQLKNIMDPNNPIIMQAMTEGKQAANANGLLNSSIAIGAAQDSAYKAAIPIAEQDAGTYNNDYATNTAADNAFSVDNQNAINAAGQFNAGAQNTLTGQQIAANASTSNAQTSANASTSNAQTAAASAQQIAQLNNTNTTNIQSASNTQQAAAQYQTALTNISSFNMDAQSKYDAELNAFNAYKNAVSLMDQKLGVPDLSGQLQFNEVNPSTGSVPSTGVQS